MESVSIDKQESPGQIREDQKAPDIMIDEMDINMLSQSVESLAPTKIKKNNKILFKIRDNNSLSKELTGTISSGRDRKNKDGFPFYTAATTINPEQYSKKKPQSQIQIGVTTEKGNKQTNLKRLYDKIINKQQKIDVKILRHLFNLEFEDLSDRVWPFVKKIFGGNFKSIITFPDFQKLIQQYVSQDAFTAKKTFFQFLDTTKDGYICDIDVFENWKHLQSEIAVELLRKDVLILMREINIERGRQGKGSVYDILQKQVNDRVSEAQSFSNHRDKRKEIIKKVDRDIVGKQVREMLKELMNHQKAQGIFDDGSVRQPVGLLGADEVPKEFKPYLNKKVNFQLYCDLMMQKNDKMRITLDEKQFGTIQFSTYGFPDLMIRLFAFLSQELPSEIATKKGRQFQWKLEV